MNVQVGDQYTTSVSRVTGIVKEIHDKPYGHVYLLDVNGADRWTTAK
jgi:hypothetical protein